MSDEPVFKLSPQMSHDERAKHVVGGRRENQPDREVLTPEDPYVEGEEYRMYVSTGILIEVDRDNRPSEDEVESVESEDEESEDMVAEESPEPNEEDDSSEVEASDEETSDDKDLELEDETDLEGEELIKQLAEKDHEQRDMEEMEEDIGPINSVEESDELSVEEARDLPELEDSPDIPPKDELNEMIRGELEELAKRVDEWENIEGSGKGGYRKVPDIVEHLAAVREDE